MTRVCKRCGVKFTPHTKAQFMCPECAKAARAEALLRARTLKCIRCGIEFEARAGAQYCRDCAREVQREHNTRYKREGAARKLGSVDYCQRCGKEYNYRTLAWNVRGHYARRGADKHLTYIAPYICRRGDEKKKPRAAEYRITEGDKEE